MLNQVQVQTGYPGEKDKSKQTNEKKNPTIFVFPLASMALEKFPVRLRNSSQSVNHVANTSSNLAKLKCFPHKCVLNQTVGFARVFLVLP